MEDANDVFWTCEDEDEQCWKAHHFKGRRANRAKGKGQGKIFKGKGRRFFKPKKGSKFAHSATGDAPENPMTSRLQFNRFLKHGTAKEKEKAKAKA